ncbi:hypothetical protein Cal6303_1717 [Calothrix sp. PCC 6303]|nr:hypothetical protein Cal6303_1717 [Calothrix sp. PCC 6303]
MRIAENKKYLDSGDSDLRSFKDVGDLNKISYLKHLLVTIFL